MGKTCFFSGHRFLPQDRIFGIKERVREEVMILFNRGVTHFISGGAIGFDTLCAELIIEMQEMDINFSEKVHLSLYLPCYDQTKKWSDYDKYKYNMLKFKASEIIYVTQGQYTPTCMHERNIAMVNASDFGIVFCSNLQSGTGQTLRYALSKDMKVCNIALTQGGIRK